MLLSKKMVNIDGNDTETNEINNNGLLVKIFKL
jgi:hypothetical protein